MTECQKAIEKALTRARLLSVAELAEETGYSTVTVKKELCHPRFMKHGREKKVHGRPPMLYKLAVPVETTAGFEHRAYSGVLEAVAAQQLALAAMIRDLARDKRKQSARKLAEVWLMEDARLKMLCDRSP